MTPNLTAFLAVVRACEGTSGPNGYRTLFGGELFTGFADHPRTVVNKSGYKSTAAGAYQALQGTWDDFIRAEGPHDFSPASQDLFARWCIQRRGALADVEAGRLRAAIEKCNKEWASLPGSPYGQPVRTVAYCEQIFHLNGGNQVDGVILAPSQPAPPMPPVVPPKPEPASQSAPPLPAQPPKETRPMGAAFISAFLPTIFELFSGRAAAAVQKVSGAPPEAAAGFVKTMAQKVEDLSGMAVTDNATALKAVAAVVDDPAKMQELQEHALDYLEKVGPLLDKLAAHELAMARQADDSADRASHRVAAYPPQVIVMVAKDSEKLTQCLVGLLILAVIAEVIFSPDHRPGAATLTLIGPLLTLVLRDRSNIVRSLFGGASESAVINAGDSAVRAAIPPGGKQ